MRLKLLLSLLILLSGCAQVELRDAHIENASDGAVVIRVIPNMASASQFFKNWQSITIERIPHHDGESKTQYAITPTLKATSRTAIYAGSLPPGTYRFVQFAAQQCGYMCVSSWVDVGQNFSRFEIQSGRLTDLGELVQVGLGEKVLFVHNTKPDPKMTAEIVQEALPGLNPLLSVPSLSWSTESVPVKMGKLFELTKAISYGFVSVKDTSHGSFVYGSSNGVVYSWLPGQAPVPHDIGSRVSVESILVTPTGRWMAGGELGVLQQSDDEGQHWSSMRGNLPFGVVVDLNHWHNNVIATSLRDNQIYVYSATEGNDSWRLLARYDMDVSLLWDIPGVRPQSFLVGDRLITTVPGRKVAVMDLNSGESEVRDLPGAMQMFSVSQDQVLRCRCAAIMAVNPYESHDFGKTWQDSTNSRFMLMPTFRDDKNGVAFKGGFFAPSRMTYTADGGNTWVETTETPIFFNQLFYSRDGKSAYAGSPDGAFWTSTDDGHHWQPVKR